MHAVQRISLSVIGLALVAFLLPTFSVAADEKEVERLIEAQRELLKVIEASAGHFWIGVSAEPSENGKGLTIEQVLPGSPAAKAGLKKGDVITTLKGKPLNKLEDLAKAISESKGEKLPLQISRDGTSEEIAVKPEKQSVDIPLIVKEEDEGKRETKKRDPQIRATEANPGKPNPANPEKPIPGLPGAAAGGIGWVTAQAQLGPQTRATAVWAGSAQQLPDDMEISISKKGNKPAVIRVSQGVKSWKTDETELGMLPAAAQAYAARMLGKPQMGIGLMPGASLPGSPMMGGGGYQRQPEARVESKREATPAQSSQPIIKQLPGGGIQIQIPEAAEKPQSKPELKPNPGPKSESKSEIKPNPEPNPSFKKPESGKSGDAQIKNIPGKVQIELREGADRKSPKGKSKEKDDDDDDDD